MEKLIILFIFVVLSFSTYAQEQVPIEFLVDAIIHVESRGDSTAIGDGGRAVGILQIHPIMVREVNRILEKNGSDVRYNYNDRYSVEKSKKMFYVWKEYYHPNSSYEKIARCWNGGTNGHMFYCTHRYWRKVSDRLETLVMVD